MGSAIKKTGKKSVINKSHSEAVSTSIRYKALDGEVLGLLLGYAQGLKNKSSAKRKQGKEGDGLEAACCQWEAWLCKGSIRRQGENAERVNGKLSQGKP